MSKVNSTILRPLALTGLVSLLAACGGEKAKINENPDQGVVTSSNGCLVSDEKCQSFIIDYPVQGINFECSSDTLNKFVTEFEGNVARGGCPSKDKVTFYIQGSTSDKRISLGTIDLEKHNPLFMKLQPTQISLLNIAAAMTGKEAQKDNVEDETYKVMVGLIRMFQAIGVSAPHSISVAGDLQPVELDKALKDDLSKLEASVDVKSFVDGSYVEKLAPWVKISDIEEATAVQVASNLLNLSNVNIYSANFMPIFEDGLVDIGGFFGKSILGNGNESIANLYLLTTRQGYTMGYAVQWTGVPKLPEDTPANDWSKVQRIRLLTQVEPKTIFAAPTTGWVNPITKQIAQPLNLLSAANSNDRLELYQGKFLSGHTIAGNEYLYKKLSGDTKAPEDKKVYGAWRQQLGNDQLTGAIDLYKRSPATYLDNRVFLTNNTVKAGSKYIFPLYANLTLDFGKATELKKETISIVIDENGDIRTNMSNNGTNPMVSDQCSVITDQANYIDNLGVKQYRIGTTGAANHSEVDKSITIRMILSNPAFGNLDGTLVGLNENLVTLPSEGGAATSTVAGGVRINLQNLIVSQSTEYGINITGWEGAYATPARWVNMKGVMQEVFNSQNKDNLSPAQIELAKRQGGGIAIELPKCYQIKTKV
ncbi:hypothetical protein EC844_13520 [Acinetobacter calcoaceticus]|uniref:Protein FilF n=1 Tax=Acinetobacter calcoaceticus TaxID=471 RepID=A0A4R1X9M3_ACICA|nr:hypothetical protein EC844_13520 [Acinetobacter calcoaceticus]